MTAEQLSQELDRLTEQRKAIDTAIAAHRQQLAETLCPFKRGDEVVWPYVRGGVFKREGRVTDIEPYNAGPHKVKWRVTIELPDGTLAFAGMRHDVALKEQA